MRIKSCDNCQAKVNTQYIVYIILLINIIVYYSIILLIKMKLFGAGRGYLPSFPNLNISHSVTDNLQKFLWKIPYWLIHQES